MAHLTWHGKIVRCWKRIDNETRFHLTETGWILRTSGPRLGGAKVIARPKEEEKKAKVFHFLSDSSQYTSELVKEKT